MDWLDVYFAFDQLRDALFDLRATLKGTYALSLQIGQWK